MSPYRYGKNSRCEFFVAPANLVTDQEYMSTMEVSIIAHHNLLHRSADGGRILEGDRPAGTILQVTRWEEIIGQSHMLRAVDLSCHGFLMAGDLQGRYCKRCVPQIPHYEGSSI